MSHDLLTPFDPPSPPFISYEDFLIQEDSNHVEWVEGLVVPMSPVNKIHQDLGGFLLTLFRCFVEERRLGTIYYEPFNMKTGPNLPGRSPDLLFVANENWSSIKENYLDGPADLVIEIVSPESGPRDRGEKYREYEKGGVREYWLLDPQKKKAEFFLLGADGKYRSMSTDDKGIYHSSVLQGLWIKVEWLWQDPLPSLFAVLKE
jgi:Uma2 family endonuclease